MERYIKIYRKELPVNVQAGFQKGKNVILGF